MATVILDVPNEKIQSFVSMILQLGIDKHRITSNAFSYNEPDNSIEKQIENYKTYRPRYWDWDVHKNELEFE